MKGSKVGNNTQTKKTFRDCLVNAISKLYEDIVKTRPDQEVNYRSTMAASQYKFTKDKFTIHAVEEVVKFSERIRFGGI